LLEVSPRLGNIGIRHVDAERRQARPCLLDEIEEAAGPAADVEEPQAALIAPCERFAESSVIQPPDWKWKFCR
jgi:hypothetical protein